MHSDDKTLDLCFHGIFHQSEGLSDFLIGPELTLKSYLRRMTASHQRHFITPLYFHSI